MKELLEFLISNITGSKEFNVTKNEEEGNVTFEVIADPNIVGLIIGKEGKTIKNLRKILSVRATKERIGVNINVNASE